MMDTMTTKTKQAFHLRKNDRLVMRNETSGKANTFQVLGSTYNDEEFPHLPVRVIVATPEPYDKKASREIGYNFRDNVEVLA